MTPSNAVAKQDQPSRAAVARANLPASIQAKIEENRARNAIVAQIRGTVWAKDVSADTVRAVAQYAHEHGLDPVTEVEILGGRIYRNAAYYRRRGADLIASGVITDIAYDHIAADPRLDETAGECEAFAAKADEGGRTDEAAEWRRHAFDARREIMRRKMARAHHAAPEKAAAVCVTTIRLANGVEVDGCNWCGGGVRGKTQYGKDADPIGETEPTKTAETRSERRAWIRLTTSDAAQKVPAIAQFAAAEVRGADDGIAIGEMIQNEQAQITAGHEAARPKMLAGTGTDVYGTAETPDGELFAAAPGAPRMQMDEAE